MEPTDDTKRAAESIDRDVAQRLGVPLLRAREIVRTVIAVLPRHLPEGVVSTLGTSFPETLGHLLDQPDLTDGTPPASDAETEPQVVTGPPLARPAHRHSVVNEANPHGETKLSSGHGRAPIHSAHDPGAPR